MKIVAKKTIIDIFLEKVKEAKENNIDIDYMQVSRSEALGIADYYDGRRFMFQYKSDAERIKELHGSRLCGIRIKVAGE
jgi:hypothetical protein